jgi:hypothetical protein
MKGSKSLIAITIAASLAIIPSAIAAPKTSIKAAGRVTTVVNTILNGIGIPAKTVGINGDFYIDTKNLTLYGPKVKGAWKVGSSLKQADSKSITTVIGEAGSVGDKGAPGEKGDKGATGNTGATGVAGLAGVAGATGAKGNDGAAGAIGMSGAAGSIGSAGPAGAPGANGSAGSPGPAGTNGAQGAQGTQGIKGDAGVAGAVGAQGVQGIQGNAGAAGGTGAAGITVGMQSAILFDTPLTGTAGSTKSSTAFGNFLPGKNYILRILISTYDLNQSISNYGLGFGIVATAGTTSISNSYVIMNGSQYSAGNRIYISVVADIVLNGTTNAAPYSLIVTLTSGANGGASISAAGTFTKIEVGSIG